LFVLFFFLLGCARTPTTTDTSAIDQNSPQIDQKETAVGRQIHETIVSSFRVYTEPRLVEYVKEIGTSVSLPAKRKDLSYQFTVLYDDRVYATSAPGGFIYLTTGFLNFLQNEAELAAVLAHEVARLQFKDRRLSESRQAVTRLAQTGAAVGPMFGQIGGLAALGLILLDVVAGASEGPIDEGHLMKADRLALRYLAEAGQDPQGLLDLQARLMAIKLGNSASSVYAYDYLFSRPVTVERYEKATKAFSRLSLEGKSLTVNRPRYLELTKGVREIYRQN
jgi:predicted Zn-dependent protease